MFRFKLPYISTIAPILLSLTFAIPAGGNQTFTASGDQQFKEKENWKRELLTQIQQGQENSDGTQLIAQRQHRTALVIGNAAYQEDRLSNPVKDATDMAKALEELGFDVILLLDLDKKAMTEAREKFSQKLRQGGVGVFYYAGHGVQVNGENYLVPLRAELNYQKDVEHDAYPLDKMINAMEAAKTQYNIVIIDACRNNPFYRRWGSPNRGLASVRGLADTDPTQGWVIAFATAPGEVAEDGQGLPNSPFTFHLLQHINTPNLDVVLMFRKVRKAVLQATNDTQKPWVRDFLVDSFSFNTILESPSTESTDTISTSPTSPQLDSNQNTNTTQPTTLSQPPRNLISKATGVNYTKLSQLLAEKKWKEADEETLKVMLQAAGRVSEGWLRIKDIEKFSCEDLGIIDQLWLESSDGKFGFSVQKEIWQKLGSPTANSSYMDWRKFYIEVGWKTEESGINSGEGYVSYDNLSAFNNYVSSKRGNLPRINTAPGGRCMLAGCGGEWLFSQTSVCNL